MGRAVRPVFEAWRQPLPELTEKAGSQFFLCVPGKAEGPAGPARSPGAQTTDSPDGRGALYEGRPPGRGLGKAGLISIRRVSLGGGYRYLLRSVAAGDGAGQGTNTLARYYASSGTPPGVFMGAGLAHLDGGRGVAPGTQVSEQHLERMFVACADPVSGEPVGGAPRAPRGGVPVAGFDLTCSPAKSVSVAWALADEATKAVIYGCHRRAVEVVLAYAEAGVFRSRSGTNGVVEEDVEALWRSASATGPAGQTTPSSTTTC